MPAVAGSVLIACLAWWRAFGAHRVELSVCMVAVTAILLWNTFHQGRKASAAIRELSLSAITLYLVARLPGRFQCLTSRSITQQ
jgi:hypothetical protein